MQGVLISGASTGIGRAFAQALAAQQFNLVLVARSQAKLEALAAELVSQHCIQTLVLAMDLTQPGAAEQVYQRVQAAGWQIDWLINNAGVGDYGEFATRPLARQQSVLQLNVVALTELTHWFLPAMRQRRQGTIMNVSSITAFQPIPYLATYAATKAYIVHFSQALWAESRADGIRVLAVCPGPTHTDFFAAADMVRNPELMAKQTYESADDVVAEALAALGKGRLVVITGGLQNHLIEFAAKLAPQRLLLRLLASQFRPPECKPVPKPLPKPVSQD